MSARRKPDRLVSCRELEQDLLAFIARHYDGRSLDIETARRALANTAAALILAHLRAAASTERPTS